MRKQMQRMVFVLCACAAQLVNGGVWLPAIFGDHMVLQAEKPVQIWGKADPGAEVTVELAGQKKSTVSDSSKHWKLTLDPMPASSKPWKLQVSSVESQVSCTNVLIGEVWLCSGQSNMRLRVDRTENFEAEIAAADHPEIRLFLTEQMAAGKPLGNLKGQWKVCSPETVAEFSADGYYFGRDLHDELKRPVGLICSAVGGTPVQAWTPQDVMEANPLTAHIQKDYEAYYATPPNQRRKSRGTWIYGAKAEKGPARLYNAMIHPLIPLAFRGAIWCQGEANDRENGMWDGPSVYKVHFPMMIQAWRDQWGQGDFPFIYVELANYMKPQTSPVDVEADVHWGPIREAQAAALALTNVYAVASIDLGEADDIHYKDKQTVGRRLLMAAMGQVYKKLPAPSLSPRYASCSIEGSQVRIKLTDAAGLHTDDGQPPHAFAIRGEDSAWKWADVSITGEELIVSHPDIVKPVAVRHAWASNPDVNVYNRAGLPLMPFRTDADAETENPVAKKEAPVIEGAVQFSAPKTIWNDASASVIQHPGAVALAANIGGLRPVMIHDVNFESGIPDASGAVTVSGNGVMLSVKSNAPGGGLSKRFQKEFSYSNSPEYSELFNSGMGTEVKNGVITLRLSGLTPGRVYHLHTFHFQPGVDPSVRQMAFECGADSANTSQPFSYHDLAKKQALNAVRMDTVWTASSSSEVFLLKAMPGFNRAVINAVALAEGSE